MLSMADSVITTPDGTQHFVEPHIESMTMKELLGKLEDCQVNPFTGMNIATETSSVW